MTPEADATPASSTVELQPYPTGGSERSISMTEFLTRTDPANASNNAGSQHTQNNDPAEFLPQPSTTVGVVERWNHPRINLYRTFATFFGFLIMGANDAAYGALIPYLEHYYHLTYVVVSLVFLSPLAGYAGAAILNNTIHVRFGQRGVAFIGPFCHVAAYLGIALHPPYPVLVIVFILAGFGNGLEDAAWNAWIGNMANANEILGFLHGFYGLGAVLSPLIATTLITKAGWPCRVTWVTALFLLGYVGAEVALGGWIVTFMIRERSGEAFASGMVATGFWTGITVGRFVLGFVTPRLGEKLAITPFSFYGR
ncbi:hypothetical protein H2199_008000 [Coniosporium tulheliwenetii]|uniref:Uncharacterized protein n=1 Tax=Coniosporium tulheliwenetii TaxID=3383036 RepID=A0ACC2YLS5_9PEZI|nr:hypothetical protein H2199_008000 [Cladosporium sp. JES 115]